MSSIKLSKKYGVNPTIPICFWCGKEKNEIALLGKLKGDIEAPKSMILNYEPCEKCEEMRSKGITIVEASETPVYGQYQEKYYGYYPTGRHFVIKDEAAKKIFTSPMIEQLIEKRMGFVDKETMDILLKMIGGNEKE